MGDERHDDVDPIDLDCSHLAGSLRDRIRTAAKGEPEAGLRESLEEYAHVLTMHCDSQIEEIAAMIPPGEVERLRSQHYAWKLHRDIHCADAGRNASDELGELQCLADLTSQYFDRREIELSEIEARRADVPGEESSPPTRALVEY